MIKNSKGEEMPAQEPIPEPRFKAYWRGTDVLAIKIGDEIQYWRRNANGFKLTATVKAT